MALIFVFSRKKAIRIVNSDTVTWKNNKKIRPMLCTPPLHGKNFLLKLLVREVTYLELGFVHKDENILWEHFTNAKG